MSVEHHRYDHPWRKRFPHPTAVVVVEGGAVFAAESEGAYWLITDEGTLADLLLPEDADMLEVLVKVERFEDEASWRAAIEDLQARMPDAARLAMQWDAQR